MLRRTRQSLSGSSNRTSPLPQSRDSNKTPKMMKEVGAWLYKKETMTAFQRWCRERQVRAYGNVKMATSPQFSRCLRVNDKLSSRGLRGCGGASGSLGDVSVGMTAGPMHGGEDEQRTVIVPGQGIVTVPVSACFNFLTVAREMGETADSVFPLQLNWMNYNERLSFLRSTAQFELAQAGWMVRIAAFSNFFDDDVTDVSASSSASATGKKFVKENGSVDFAPYVSYLLEDTRGRDGVAQGISREREEDSGLLDHYFSEMATDSCEDPEVFLERMFVSLAALFHRSQPIEAEAMDYFLRGGVNFFKAKKDDMFVPTLMPLIDSVPQREDGGHNTTVEYFPYKDEETLKAQMRELRIPFFEKGKARPTGECVNSQGQVEQVVNAEHELMDAAVLRGGGFFALRALQPLEVGDVLYVRRFPWVGGDAGAVEANAQVTEANRLINFDA